MSNKSSKKPKRILKSREELVSDLKKQGDFVKKMKFTKEQFYPALMEASSSVEDAKEFVSSVATHIMQQFLGIMKEKKLIELDLVSKLDKSAPNYGKWVALVKLFDDFSAFDARDMIEGMRNEIQLFIDEEMRDRPLSSLKTNWIDDLPKK